MLRARGGQNLCWNSQNRGAGCSAVISETPATTAAATPRGGEPEHFSGAFNLGLPPLLQPHTQAAVRCYAAAPCSDPWRSKAIESLCCFSLVLFSISRSASRSVLWDAQQRRSQMSRMGVRGRQTCSAALAQLIRKRRLPAAVLIRRQKGFVFRLWVEISTSANERIVRGSESPGDL